MAKEADERRVKELTGLDIDRRRTDARRDGQRRPWLDKTYEEIYISSYVNAIYPRFPSRVHAFSNLEGDSELSPAEWAVAHLALSDAQSSVALRTLQSFASEMIKKGLVVDNGGKAVLASENIKPDAIEHYLLKTGT